jgi:uncharacterized RDD family membrane protein YckC
METEKNCPNCGQPLPASALDGLCPACMLQVGAAADSVPEPVLGPGGTVVTPEPDAPPMASPELGQHLGRYKILRRLGHGGMGVVYEAEESDSGRRVALKVINHKLGSPADRARFLREGRLAASVNHPNCVYVFGTEEIGNTPVIAMEFVSGGTLQQRLSREGPLPVGRAVDAILQVVEGLEAAQAVGILHRDIKPSNCFEDAHGKVKIGDFGLSISTLPREESNITESGAMVGTPAFSSPEQLRGEEFSARADMYAVGVALFYLLTGKLPFEGHTMPQLIANILEQRPPSPRQHRAEIPNGLARVILRCLDKQPTERFKNYAELRLALEPYSSTAPTAATLGLRFLAGVTDLVALSLIGLTVTFLGFGGPFGLLDRMIESPSFVWLFVLPWFVLALLYYAICEWRWGATPGKALCRLRVLQTDRNYPGLGQALLRATIYTLVPMLPYWIVAGRDPLHFTSPSAGTYLLSLSYYMLLALLFASARRRNGFAALQDLATRTRVVSRSVLEHRQALAVSDLQPAGVESYPTVGPFHVLQSLGKADGAEWVEGYDLRLLRRVMIRQVAAGTPPLPAGVHHVARVGRLRWLAGRRDDGENWDAFEGVGGQPLLKLVDRPQPWDRVRFWLHDLAEELGVAEKDGSLPPVLALDRVWITREGRAKLLDFPAPGVADDTVNAVNVLSPPAAAASQARRFLDQVAAIALGGWAARNQPAATVAALIPLHARRFLETLPALANADNIAGAIRPLLRRVAEVTRLRRALIVAGCVAFPLVTSLAGLLGISMMQSWHQKNPDLMALTQVLNTWRATKMPWVPKDQLPSDRLIGIYIAAHFGGVITNEPVWSGTLARMMIQPDARVFAERSLEQYSGPKADELKEAEKRLGPLVKQAGMGNLPPVTLLSPFILWFALLFYVGIPAVIATLLFRGGLVLLALGVTYVRRDGCRASRGRVLWRSVVAWSPMVGAVMICGAAMAAKSVALALLSVVLVIGVTAWSLLLPGRGLQDRLAGTWPVPR